MKTRPIKDTAAERHERAIALARIVDGKSWSNEFILFHLEKMIDEAQEATAARTRENLDASMEREWVAIEPVPAPARLVSDGAHNA